MWPSQMIHLKLCNITLLFIFLDIHKKISMLKVTI